MSRIDYGGGSGSRSGARSVTVRKRIDGSFRIDGDGDGDGNLLSLIVEKTTLQLWRSHMRQGHSTMKQNSIPFHDQNQRVGLVR